MAWILRDWNVVVLLHSRSSFANVQSGIDANASGWIWAIESMCSLRKNKVIFAVEASDLLGAVIRRPAWPSFRWFSHRIIGSLNSVGHWKLELIARKANLSAFLIAKSVISENLHQSYVARSHTRWLAGFFVKVFTSCYSLLVEFDWGEFPCYRVVLVSVLLKYE